MTANRRKPPRRIARIFAIIVAVIVLAVAAAFPYAGRYLIVDRPLQAADAIVVLGGSRVERWLEAVDLYKEKIAPQLLLSPGPVEAAEVTLRERGINFPREADLARDAIVQLGVPSAAVHVIPGTMDNTAQEAAATRDMVRQHGWTSLIVVTSKFHTRRSLYAFEREFKGTGVKIQVRPTRYDEARADGWWKRRADFRSVTSELQKLLAYRLGLRL